MFLSMWLSNSATTAMMVPIIDAVLLELHPSNDGKGDKLRKALMMSAAYAANLGGTGTIIGTGPNLLLKGFLDDTYGAEQHGITFASWMLFNIPGMLICVVLAWIWLQIRFIGFK
ncbi:SLC13A5 (predicted) [Pycnogonum litorale]